MVYTRIVQRCKGQVWLYTRPIHLEIIITAAASECAEGEECNGEARGGDGEPTTTVMACKLININKVIKNGLSKSMLGHLNQARYSSKYETLSQ